MQELIVGTIVVIAMLFWGWRLLPQTIHDQGAVLLSKWLRLAGISDVHAQKLAQRLQVSGGCGACNQCGSCAKPDASVSDSPGSISVKIVRAQQAK